jgi:hypothetical protein
VARPRAASPGRRCRALPGRVRSRLGAELGPPWGERPAAGHDEHARDRDVALDLPGGRREQLRGRRLASVDDRHRAVDHWHRSLDDRHRPVDDRHHRDRHDDAVRLDDHRPDDGRRSSGHRLRQRARHRLAALPVDDAADDRINNSLTAPSGFNNATPTGNLGNGTVTTGGTRTPGTTTTTTTGTSGSTTTDDTGGFGDLLRQDQQR